MPISLSGKRVGNCHLERQMCRVFASQLAIKTYRKNENRRLSLDFVRDSLIRVQDTEARGRALALSRNSNFNR